MRSRTQNLGAVIAAATLMATAGGFPYASPPRRDPYFDDIKTQDDTDRLNAAQAKRERRALKRSKGRM